MPNLLKKYLPAVPVLFLASIYLVTLAPGLTWAYDGADGGDFLAALATGGVPHPSGYPTYILLATGFVKIPLGSLAFRSNLFSAFCMVLASFFLYKFVLHHSKNHFVAVFAALLFGTFPLVWSQALITEVYALQTLLTVSALHFLLSYPSGSWWQFAGGFILGLAVGNHLTALFLLPVLVLEGSANSQETEDAKPLALSFMHLGGYFKRLVGLLIGLQVYWIIPLRAQNQAPVNWGKAIDWKGFWWLISGRMYQNRLGHLSEAYWLTSLQSYSRFLYEQLGIVLLAIAIFYIVIFFHRSRFFIVTIWLVLVYSLFAMIYYSPDSYVYLILPLMGFAIWVGLGCQRIIEKLVVKKATLKPLLMILVVAFVMTRAVWMMPEMDLSSDTRAEEYAQNVLESLPEDAVVITRGDEALFSLWYFQYALEERTDVVIVSRELYDQAWYREVLHETYEPLIIPESFSSQALQKANQQRPVCILETNLTANFSCLQ